MSQQLPLGCSDSRAKPKPLQHKGFFPLVAVTEFEVKGLPCQEGLDEDRGARRRVCPQSLPAAGAFTLWSGKGTKTLEGPTWRCW